MIHFCGNPLHDLPSYIAVTIATLPYIGAALATLKGRFQW